jgi:hypothetical protein
MLMKPLVKLIAGTAAALILATGGASAAATVLSFGFNGIGTYTVDTGNITAATATKTIPLSEAVNTISTPVSATLANILLSCCIPHGFNPFHRRRPCQPCRYGWQSDVYLYQRLWGHKDSDHANHAREPF